MTSYSGQQVKQYTKLILNAPAIRRGICLTLKTSIILFHFLWNIKFSKLQQLVNFHLIIIKIFVMV